MVISSSEWTPTQRYFPILFACRIAPAWPRYVNLLLLRTEYHDGQNRSTRQSIFCLLIPRLCSSSLMSSLTLMAISPFFQESRHARNSPGGFLGIYAFLATCVSRSARILPLAVEQDGPLRQDNYPLPFGRGFISRRTLLVLLRCHHRSGPKKQGCHCFTYVSSSLGDGQLTFV